jgi:two-component system phosphate regulon sensor histidine kinase PhoR
MWPFLTVVALLLATGIYFISSRRLRADRSAHERQLGQLRERAQHDAERTRAQQKAFFNSMSEGLLLLDDRGTIHTSNRALHEIFNVPEQVIGKTVMEAFRLHALSEIVEKLKTEQHVLDFELEVPALKSKWVQVSASTILDENKRRLGAVLVFHDVTRLKQLENTRQEFVANVSHELRTPLSMIKGYAETLLSGAISDPEVSTRYLQTIERHADRLAHLINDLLTISQLESGRINLNLAPIKLGSVVDSVFQELRARADAHAVTTENRIASDVTVVADGDRLRQVFLNLIENAIKYGKKGGRVAVSVEQPDANMIQVSVSDDGPGIPPDALPRIFERFYRVDKARSREAGGTGLGLAIVKHIVQCHGGKVWVESELGKGSTFYFTLNA